MVKFISAVYVFLTSIAYFYLITSANKWYEEKLIAFPVLSAIVVFLAFLISFFKDKINEFEVGKRLGAKDSEIAKLLKKIADKDMIIHKMKSTIVQNVLSSQGQSPEEFLEMQRTLALTLNEDPVINNLTPEAEEDISSYLDILQAKHRP